MTDLSKSKQIKTDDEGLDLYGKFRENYIELHRKIDDMEAMVANLRTHVTYFRFDHVVDQVAALELAAMELKNAIVVPCKTELAYNEKYKEN